MLSFIFFAALGAWIGDVLLGDILGDNILGAILGAIGMVVVAWLLYYACSLLCSGKT